MVVVAKAPSAPQPAPEAESVEAPVAAVGIEDSEGDVFDPSALVLVEADIVAEQ